MDARSLVVAIEGQSGSGKTRLINDLMKAIDMFTGGIIAVDAHTGRIVDSKGVSLNVPFFGPDVIELSAEGNGVNSASHQLLLAASRRMAMDYHKVASQLNTPRSLVLLDGYVQGNRAQIRANGCTDEYLMYVCGLDRGLPRPDIVIALTMVPEESSPDAVKSTWRFDRGTRRLAPTISLVPGQEPEERWWDLPAGATAIDPETGKRVIKDQALIDEWVRGVDLNQAKMEEYLLKDLSITAVPVVTFISTIDNKPDQVLNKALKVIGEFVGTEALGKELRGFGTTPLSHF